MRILNIGLFLLLGACSVAADQAPAAGEAPAAENFGGDINSPNGRAWLARISSGVLWETLNDNGFKTWTRGNNQRRLNRATGDITGLHVNGVVSVFLGAPSPTTAFYKRLRFSESTVDSGFIEERVFGVFISNVSDQPDSMDGGRPKTFIYTAALKLGEGEINAIRRQLGLGDGTKVEAASTEVQKRYNALVYRPANYDLNRAPIITSLGDETSRPEAIIIPDLPMP